MGSIEQNWIFCPSDPRVTLYFYKLIIVFHVLYFISVPGMGPYKLEEMPSALNPFLAFGGAQLRVTRVEKNVFINNARIIPNQSLLFGRPDDKQRKVMCFSELYFFRERIILINIFFILSRWFIKSTKFLYRWNQNLRIQPRKIQVPGAS